MYRPVRVYSREWISDQQHPEGGEWELTPETDGVLLTITVDHEIVDDHPAHYPVGLVESAEGYIMTVPVENLQFLGPTEGAN